MSLNYTALHLQLILFFHEISYFVIHKRPYKICTFNCNSKHRQSTFFKFLQFLLFSRWISKKKYVLKVAIFSDSISFIRYSAVDQFALTKFAHMMIHLALKVTNHSRWFLLWKNAQISNINSYQLLNKLRMEQI
jgi:hypothetical protein